MKRLALVLGCLCFLSCRGHEPASVPPTATPSPTASNTSTFKLMSSAFQPAGTIPRKYTCDGENVSPPLTWTNPPANTKSLALIVDDPDAPGKTWVHWIVYDVPPNLNSLNENVASTIELAGTARQGTNDFKAIGYGGPCPPNGVHRYFFKLYALDAATGLKNPGATVDELMKQIQGHTLQQTELMGTYKRQP